MGSDIKSLVEPIVRKLDISKLAGKILAIDGNNMAYQFLSAIKTENDYLRDKQGNITSHLAGTFYRLGWFLENKIKLVIVFDGAPPDFKKATIEKRAEIRAKEGSAKFTSAMKEEMIELMKAMGIFTIIAPSEGEAQASYLAARGKVYAVNSQDYDSFLFGASRVVRNYDEKKYFDYVELSELLAKFNINREKLILIAMLVGNDYNKGIPGVGVVRALEIINSKTKQEIISLVEETNEVDAEKIFNFFLNPPAIDVEINFPKFDKDKIYKILVEKHDFSEERVRKKLESIEQAYTKKTIFDI